MNARGPETTPSSPLLQLPVGLTQRPLALPDARAVAELMAAEEQHDLGAVLTDEADIIGDWQKPSFLARASTVGVFDQDRLVAYAEFGGGDRGDAAVLPGYRGRGIGTSLAKWMQAAARQSGSTVIGMPAALGSPSDRLLEQLGYRVRWTSWVLTLPEGRRIEPQPLPVGYLVRAARESEYPAVWTVLEDAFLEWSVRERQSFDDFTAGVMLRPGFAPWNLRVAIGPDESVVGVAFVILADETAHIAKIAVRKDRRGLGLARALLVDAFERGREHGASRSELSTDSRTGALGLYEKVGMQVTSVWVNRGIDL